MAHNEEKNQSRETDLGLTQAIHLEDEYITVIAVFHVFKQHKDCPNQIETQKI